MSRSIRDMTEFRYKALARNGDVLSGQISATDEQEAVRRVQELGHYPISVSAGLAGFVPQNLFSGFRQDKLTARHIGAFILQLSSLVGAGLPVDRAIAILKETMSESALQRLLSALLTDIQSGLSLSESLSRTKEQIPAFYVTTIRAAEEGGFLVRGLKRLAEHHGKNQALRDMLRSAMIYPSILIVMAGLSVVFILMVVLPQFRAMFEGAGVELPLPAAVLMSMSGFLENHFTAILLFLVLSLVSILLALRSAALRTRLATASLRIPLVGDAITRFELAKFSYALGLLLENGIALQQSLGLAGNVIGNPFLADAVRRSSDHVREGMSLADSLVENKFPSTVTALIRVGEETGHLPAALNHLAELLDKDVHQKLERLIAYLIPAITIGLGAGIALLIASVFTALISINELAI